MEDQALIGLLIDTILQEAGYQVFLAGNGEEALAMAQSIDELSAVIADIHLLGQLDGRAVIRSLRRNRPFLPVVVVTGFHPEAPEANLRGLGGPTVRLGKPFAAEDLIASLADVLSSTTGRATSPSGEAPRRRNGAAPSRAGLLVGGPPLRR
ncbi:response regulator [Belnapia sp. F-4-1]|uniref:response regulator n=1 Tax=Belnapia sp. F-4-1 TaxID=1545443 RepID=UPI00068A5AE1|nr:response regulator [Belnapia sp. F-4-1]